MHEIRSRAQLRGKPPEEIFSTENCLMLCFECHHLVTARRILIETTTDRGADDKVKFIEDAGYFGYPIQHSHH